MGLFRFKVSTGLVVALLACSTAFAQANRGSITGTVSDQTGAVVPSAPVEARNVETGAVFSGGASGTGNFVIPVPSGSYELSVAATGFKKFVQTGVPVIEGQATRRDVRLELGQVAEVTTVTDTAPLLKTENGDVSYRVATEIANQIPVLTMGGSGAALGNLRNPLSMTQLLPGVQFSTAGFTTLTVNGLPANSQTWTIEGQDATPTLWRGVTATNAQGSVEAIQAMTVQTSNFAAEFGKAGGAAINYTMKSGTNQLHGSAYNYMVNEFLNAGTPNTDWIDQGPRYAYKEGQHIRARQRRYDLGFTLGGPISIPKVYNGKDKSWFFFSLNQFRESAVTATGTATVPTLAYRQGDFSSAGCTNFNVTAQICAGRPAITNTVTGQSAVDSAGVAIQNGAIYDPNTFRTVGGIPVRDLFPGQQIPLSRMDAVARRIQDLFPTPTNNNLTNNYAIPGYENFRRITVPSFKVDHVLSSTLRVSGYYSANIRSVNNANGFLAEQFPWTGSQAAPIRNHTIRVNIDKTISPTVLLHVGLGYLHQKEPNVAAPYDQTKLGWPGSGGRAFPYPNIFPTIGGLNNPASGGFSPAIGGGFDAIAWEQKPTGNVNLTWVKGNHTLKFGGDITLQGYPTHNNWRANGNFTFNAAQSGNPWEQGQALNIANPTGFAYASFLMGAPNQVGLAQPTFTRLGGNAWAVFAQDTWKATRKMTIEYGLRYDFQTYLREQHGRLAGASFTAINPAVGLPGAQVYEATCNCRMSSNYPYAFGPRFNVAYQLDSKTVLRGGVGVNYNVVQTPAGNNFSVGDFYEINQPAYGLSAMPQGFAAGNTFYSGNPFGNTEVIWPVYDPGRLPAPAAGLRPPATNIRVFHPGSRPGRILQWSFGLQREVLRDLVVEASYVGNRGMWFYSPLLDTQSTNSLAAPGYLSRYGLDISNAADRALLNQPLFINGVLNPTAAAKGIRRPYDTFPTNETVGQAIRPIPHWQTVNPYLGPNRGNTWYDALQVQATKRYSHGLNLNGNFTWAHGSALGASSDTDFFLSGRPTVTNPFNRQVNKQINQLVPPLKVVISGTYQTPGISGATGALKFVSVALKNWQVGVVLQYQSGQLLTVPNSNNQLSQQLRINSPQSGAAGAGNSFGAGVANYNPWNYTPGAPFFREGFDPNGSFDPRSFNAGSPAASGVLASGFAANGTCAIQPCSWTDAAPGTWGTTAPFLEGYRWRRAPNEAFNVGRKFNFGGEGRYEFFIRAEFQNVLNRMIYAAPATLNPLAPVTTFTQRGQVFPIGGYGVVNTLNGAGSNPRSGQLVARFTF